MPTYARVEIPKKVKLSVFERAGGPGNVCCEGECGLPLRGKAFQYHHRHPEFLQNVHPSERPPITPEDVQLLCVPCHAAISAKDTTARAHGKRIVEKAAGLKSRRPIYQGKFKRKLDGTVVDRETGEIIGKGR